MKKVKEFLQHHWLFDVLSFVSLALIIASFVVPPTGQIDPSVLAATGEIAGFSCLYIVLIAIEKGVDAQVQHGNTSVTVGDFKEAEAVEE